jgi:hypothetical protein
MLGIPSQLPATGFVEGPYLMEFDETLAEGIARGPMAIEDALKIALQIAEELKAAHEHPSCSRPAAAQMPTTA